MSVTVLLIGCGKMGGALLQGWLQARCADSFIVVEPRGDQVVRDARVRWYSEVDRVYESHGADIIVIAVKPQILEKVLPLYRKFVRAETVFVSIVAGKSSEKFTSQLGTDLVFVRTMPNTAVAVKEGITVAFAHGNVTPVQRSLVERLFKAVGECLWVSEESLMDGVTALSGGGPAYIFLLIEILARAGVRQGLPEELALRLARATVIGSSGLLCQSSESVSELRRNVTSPGGTTQAALEVLMDPKKGLAPLFERAITAATQRSQFFSKD